MQTTRHVLTRVAKCILVDGEFFDVPALSLENKVTGILNST
jgi:hypothetical protein